MLELLNKNKSLNHDKDVTRAVRELRSKGDLIGNNRKGIKTVKRRHIEILNEKHRT